MGDSPRTCEYCGCELEPYRELMLHRIRYDLGYYTKQGCDPIQLQIKILKELRELKEICQK